MVSLRLTTDKLTSRIDSTLQEIHCRARVTECTFVTMQRITRVCRYVARQRVDKFCSFYTAPCIDVKKPFLRFLFRARFFAFFNVFFSGFYF